MRFNVMRWIHCVSTQCRCGIFPFAWFSPHCRACPGLSASRQTKKPLAVKHFGCFVCRVYCLPSILSMGTGHLLSHNDHRQASKMRFFV
jgi:hypothetical protein